MSEERTPIRHIAFIPDGNRRWARSHRMRFLFGHRTGFETIRRSYDWLVKRGVRYATFFVFSTENWHRSKEEVDYLFGLFREVAQNALDELQEKGVRLRYIGNLARFPRDIQEKLLELESLTAGNENLNLIFSLGYSGRDEIVRAVRKISDDVVNHRLKISDISESLFSSYLDTHDIPDPDIVIRTSERRLSNFLLWQLSYSEIFFVDKYWPDFNEEDFNRVIEEFSHRVRRYGI